MMAISEKFKRTLSWSYRRSTNFIRSFPDFIIIGAMKCGTTSLYSYLSLHPQVVPAYNKEVHYFDSESYASGSGWYKAHFPSVIKKNIESIKCGNNIITGEASPYYLYFPRAHTRIAESIPNVKLIIMFRNPIDRAFSHYHHQQRKGREKLSFEQAIEIELDRLDGEEKKILSEENYYSYNYWAYSYLARGRYAEQLERWFTLFPRINFHIMESDDFFKDTPKELNNVYEFLGIKHHVLDAYKKLNIGTYNKMSVTSRKMLAEYFAPHNEKLFKLINKRFNWGE